MKGPKQVGQVTEISEHEGDMTNFQWQGDPVFKSRKILIDDLILSQTLSRCEHIGLQRILSSLARSGATLIEQFGNGNDHDHRSVLSPVADREIS